MDGLTILATNAVSAWTRKLLNGRPHWVGPATMIVPGVLNGSKGALLYPPEEIQRSTPAWNGMPITNGHPQDESGRYVSARSPAILERYELGKVLSANYSDKLNAEAWLDEELCKNKAPELLERVQNNLPIELSTGLGTEDDYKPGTWVNAKRNQSRPYDAIARNYTPDHLAVLLGQRGACSIADGCGLGVNSSGKCSGCGGDMVEGKCSGQGHGQEHTEDDQKQNDGTGMAGSPISFGSLDPEPLRMNAVARMWQILLNAFKPNQPRSEVTGKIKPLNAGQGKGPHHEAAQDGFYQSIGGHIKPGTETANDEEEEPAPEAQTVNDLAAALNGSPDQPRDPDGKFASGGGGGGQHTIKAQTDKSGDVIGYSVVSPKGEHVDFYDHKHEAQMKADHLTKGGNPRTPLSDIQKAQTTNQGVDEMKTRKDKIAFLVANCDCWKTKGELLANEKMVDDKMLDGLVANAQAVEAGKLAVNTLNEVAEVTGFDTTLASNAMPAFIKKAIEDKKDGGKDDDEEDDAGDKKPTTNKRTTKEDLTMNLSNLTPTQLDQLSVAMFGQPRATVNAGMSLAMNYEKREKQIVINNLTAHITDPVAKAARAKKLAALNLDELYDRQADLPQATVNHSRQDSDDRLPVYLGGLRPEQTPVHNAADADEVLDEPTMNWGKKTASSAA